MRLGGGMAGACPYLGSTIDDSCRVYDEEAGHT